MFAKSTVSQSMIDAVNKVLGEEPVQQVQSTQAGSQPVEHKETMLNETAPIKEPTKTGMRVYGGSYGNSAKAKQDQTKKDIDDLKGPKDKEMKEELKGNQDKIDANHNGEIDAQDFKILRGKKKVKEGREFTEKLLETVRKSDVPAYLRKAKGDTPLTVADVKAPKKDSISAPENLAKARNEEVELEEDGPGRKWRQGLPLLKSRAVSNRHDAEAKYPDEKRTWVARGYDGDQKEPVQRAGRNKEDPLASRANIKSASKGTAKTNRTLKQTIKSTLNKEDVSEYELDEMLNEVLSKDASAGDWIHDFVHSDNPKFAGKSKAERKKMALGAYYGAQKEEAEITTDTLAGRKDGGDQSSFTHFKKKLNGFLEKDPCEDDPEETPSRASIKAKPTNNLAPQKVKNQDSKYGTANSFQEATIAGTPGWEKIEKNVKDKSGAIHTPMSRAKDLARQAFKKVNDKTKVKESMLGQDGQTSESKK